MNKFSFILADLEPGDLLGAQTRFSYQILLMFGAVFLAAVVGAIWAVLYSKKKKKRKHRPNPQQREPVLMNETTTAAGENLTRKKLRRSRRPHRPLNPTLAQTRGLPPMRDENSPLPPMP